jgi:hypothetical protein
MRKTTRVGGALAVISLLALGACAADPGGFPHA